MLFQARPTIAGQDVAITGSAGSDGGQPIVNLPVTLNVVHNGYQRNYTAYTNDSGEYRYTFQPRSDEAGSYTVRAVAMHEGVQETATAEFDILGLYQQPAALTVHMSMNSSKTVNFSLKKHW